MKILIVDDDKDVARAIGRALTIRNHEVQMVHTFQAGMAALVEDPVDVVLLDRNLFGKDGWSLRDVAPTNTKVVLMTGDPPNDAPPHYRKGRPMADLFAMVEG